MDKLDYFFEIVYQNENFLVINKENGISTQHNVHYSESVEKILGNFGNPFSKLPRCGIVHRLDKWTTGLLIIAKNLDYFIFLTSLFKEKKIHKEYISLHEGNLKSHKGEISFFLKKKFSKNKKVKMVLSNSEGKFVKIYFKVISINNGFSLLNVNPITGRTHQIRLAFQLINFPIYNDPVYNKYILNCDNDDDYGQYLHAYRISFFDKENFDFVAKIPPFFKKKINSLSIIFD